MGFYYCKSLDIILQILLTKLQKITNQINQTEVYSNEHTPGHKTFAKVILHFICLPTSVGIRPEAAILNCRIRLRQAARCLHHRSCGICTPFPIKITSMGNLLEKLEKHDEDPIHAAGRYFFRNDLEKNEAYSPLKTILIVCRESLMLRCSGKTQHRDGGSE